MKKINMQTVKRLFEEVRKYRARLWLILLFSLVANVLSLATPMIIGFAIDHIAGLGAVDFPAVLRYILILAGCYLVSAVLTWLCAVLANNIAYRTANALRIRCFQRILHLPLGVIDRHPHGDYISRLSNDADAVADGLNQLLVQFFSGIITVLSALGFMLYLSPLITLAVIIVTPLTFLVAKTVTRLSTSKFREQQAIVGELGGFIEEQLAGQEVVKAFHHEDAAQADFEEINSRLYSVGQKAQLYSSFTNPTTRFVNHISYIAVGLVGGLGAILSGFSVGVVASFLTYSSLFSKPFNEFTAITTQLLAALASADRIFQTMDETPEPPDPAGAQELPRAGGSVTFDKVRFSYTPERPLIENFSLQVPGGSSVAIVGPTGAGKTTLVNLLMRFYEVTGGDILIDGVSIMDMKRDSLRRGFGMVLQDTWLFRGTIRDNIAYGCENATDEEIVNAAKMAHAHGFITRLPEGYDTVISEDGSNLSSGQKQLITIARAMLLDPPMLILDEATSSVDTLTEQRIQKAFMRLMQGRTSFVIAHRLSTIREADIIIVMNQGNIVEQGTHRELLEKGGFYSRLYNSQFENP